MRALTSAILTMVLMACGPADRSDPPDAANAEIAGGNAVNPRATAPAFPAVPAHQANPFISQYTSGGIKPCKLIDKNEEEGGYFRHRCPGVGGFGYEVVESDLRQSLVVIQPGGHRDEVPLVSVVGGGGFNNLGPTIEWRGPAGKPPTTMTVRFNVHEDDDPKVPDRSYLVVVRLAPPACAVGAVPPGPEQNARARAIADSGALECFSR